MDILEYKYNKANLQYDKFELDESKENFLFCLRNNFMRNESERFIELIDEALIKNAEIEEMKFFQMKKYSIILYFITVFLQYIFHYNIVLLVTNSLLALTTFYFLEFKNPYNGRKPVDKMLIDRFLFGLIILFLPLYILIIPPYGVIIKILLILISQLSLLPFYLKHKCDKHIPEAIGMTCVSLLLGPLFYINWYIQNTEVRQNPEGLNCYFIEVFEKDIITKYSSAVDVVHLYYESENHSALIPKYYLNKLYINSNELEFKDCELEKENIKLCMDKIGKMWKLKLTDDFCKSH